jgi:multiple sugar transport system substrate-binding protein
MQRHLQAGLAALALAGAAATADAAAFNVWGIQTFNPEADRYIGEEVKKFGQARGIDAEYVVVPANVLYERLAAAFEGGAPPDVFMVVGAQVQYYIQRDLLIPLDDTLAKLRAVPGGIFENVVPQGMSQGRAMAVPIEVDVSPMNVRTDLFEKAGKPLPKTWEELREAVKVIQQQNPLVAGFGLPVSNAADAEGNLRNIVWSFGGAEFAEDGRTVTIDSPETRAAFQFVADMFLVDRTIPRSALTWDDAGNNTAYQTGRAAVVINPPSIFFWLQQNDPKLLANTQLINIPKGPGPKGRNGTSVGAWVWAVSKAGKNHDAAKAWLDHFYEPARYQAVIEKVGGRWLPVFRSMMAIPTFTGVPQYAEFKDMAETGILAGFRGPPTPLSGKVNNAQVLTKALQKVLVDTMKVADATAWAQAEMERLAKE